LNDAANPEAMVCVAGDTPGPLGTGNDGGDDSFSAAPNSCEADFPVVAIDMEKMRRILYAVAYSEASNASAKVGFWSSEVDLGNPKQVESAAAAGGDRLMDELLEAMEAGPESLQTFLHVAEQRKQSAAAQLKAKLDDEGAAGRSSVELWGTLIKFCANVKFVSTVSVKTLGVFTGLGGTGVDIVYSATTDALGIGDSKGVLAVGFTEGGEAIAEKINELIAASVMEKGFMTARERNQLQGWLGNYKGNAKKIHEQLDKIEGRIAKQLDKGKSVSNLTARRLKKLKALKAIRRKTAGKLLRSAGTYKKGLGKGVGKVAAVVFLANDVSDAWDQLQREHAAASR
jgi:hypothetical protein